MIRLRCSLLLFGCFWAACVQAQNLHITTGFTPPVSDFYKEVLMEAARRMGDDLSISFEVLPAERSVELVSRGINDGECCRIPEVINKSYENVVFVNESFARVKFSAFSKDSKLPIFSFADLKPYSVATVRGWKISVIKVHEAGPAVEHVVTTPEQLFEMLANDRIDVGVVGYASGLKTVADLGLEGIHVHEPPLLEVTLYLMLADEHAHLIPEFDAVFGHMREDGTTARLYQDMIDSMRH